MSHRGTPTATLNLQIPSLHDSLLLDTRIYLPSAYTCPTATTPWERKVAVVAHPYAPLGGSYDDCVVLRVVSVLLKTGWVVASFNFRGVHGSKGRTTWTGSAEVMDYTSVVAWVLAYVQSLPPPESPAPSPMEVYCREGVEVEVEEISLLLAGYSYGSLIASHLPSTDRYILPLISHPPTDKTVFTGAIDAARCSARRWRDSHSSRRTSYTGSTVNRTDVLQEVLQEDKVLGSPVKEQQDNWEDREKVWKVVTSYLLVSPLLPPVSSFLMGFGQGRVSSWTGWTKGLVGIGNHHHRDLDGATEDSSETLGIDEPGTKVLAVYGDEDMFTSVRKYRKWKEKMCGISKVWKGVEVEGAGHFWHESGALEELAEAVICWGR